jgi:hypothetical protein
MQAPILADPAEFRQSKASNDPLPETTQKLVYRHIAEVEGRVIEIDREIDEFLTESLRIKRQIKALEKEKSMKSGQLKTLRATISPLKRFSPELLSEIFLKYTENVTTHLPPRSYGRHESILWNGYSTRYIQDIKVNVWGLGHVCARWRHVLWDTPGVFHTLAVHGPPNGGQSHNIQNSLHRILLCTTGLIDLSITSYPSAGVTDLIISFNHRLRRLSLYPATHLEPLLNLPLGSFGALRDLHLESNLDIEAPETTVWQGLPNLQKLTLAGDSWRRYSLPIIFSPAFTKLTGLTIESVIPFRVVHSILQHTNNLVRAKIFIGGNDDYIHSTSPVVIPHLEELRLIITGYMDWALFLQPLVATSLTTFSCGNQRHPPCQFYPRALISFIERSRCSITCLETFAASFITPPAVFRAMRRGLLPSLKNGDFRIGHVGLSAFIDYILFKVKEKKGPDARTLSFRFLCYPEWDIADARTRYVEFCSEHDLRGHGIFIDGYNALTGEKLIDGKEEDEEEGSYGW